MCLSVSTRSTLKIKCIDKDKENSPLGTLLSHLWIGLCSEILVTFETLAHESKPHEPGGPDQGPRGHWPLRLLWSLRLLASSRCYFFLRLFTSPCSHQSAFVALSPGVCCFQFSLAEESVSVLLRVPVGRGWSWWVGYALLPKPLAAHLALHLSLPGLPFQALLLFPAFFASWISFLLVIGQPFSLSILGSLCSFLDMFLFSVAKFSVPGIYEEAELPSPHCLEYAGGVLICLLSLAITASLSHSDSSLLWNCKWVTYPLLGPSSAWM